MIDLMASTTLWAMHPAFLDAILKKNTLTAMLPDALTAFAAGFQQEAKGPADPIRDGATVIMPVKGVIAPRGIYGGTGTYSDVFADRIREFGADDKVGTIILDIGSPGGLVYGTQEAGDAIFDVRQIKPVVAVANPYAFSAAYWLACQCTAFYASPSADVGSVGVRSGHTDISGLEDKLGMKTTLVASSPDKIAGHPYAPLSDDDRDEMQASVDDSNKAFVAAIARGRGMSASDVPAMHGTGKIFSAPQATANGAIDGVMSLRDVVAKYQSSRNRLALMRRRADAAALASAI